MNYKQIITFHFSDLYDTYGLFERLTKIEEEFPGANVILHKISYMPEVRFMIIPGKTTRFQDFSFVFFLFSFKMVTSRFVLNRSR